MGLSSLVHLDLQLQSYGRNFIRKDTWVRNECPLTLLAITRVLVLLDFISLSFLIDVLIPEGSGFGRFLHE